MSDKPPLLEACKTPEDCATMSDVRAGIDALDARIVDLLATRFSYMRAAARIKPERGMVRDEDRKTQVIAQACARAEQLGLPEPVIRDMWERLVEGSIAYELDHWDRSRA